MMQQELVINGYRFEIQPDPGNPKLVLVTVFQNGEQVMDLHGAPFSKTLPAGAAERIETFCRNFATDEAFRTSTIVQHSFSCC